MILRDEESLPRTGYVGIDLIREGFQLCESRGFVKFFSINCSPPGFLGYGDGIRFLEWYLEIHAISMQKRDLINAILDESRKRGLVYVSPKGDVTE
jgi:hypothetical protein